MSRKIEDLTPETQEKFQEFKEKMDDAEIPFMVTFTRRTQAEQEELWAQGRTKPGKIVTWTLKSKHLEGKAFDIAILKNGKPVWDVKVDVNFDEEPDYYQAGLIGERVGLIWGGRFRRADFPHFELNEES